MTRPSKPLENLPQQEVAPDAAGIEPSTEAISQPQNLTPSKHFRSRADLPVNISTILALALPTIIEQFLAAAIGITDTVVAGHTGDSDDVHSAAAAAVGAMSYLQWFASIMTAAMAVGATAIVARSIGAHRPRIANRVAGTVCVAALLVGILTSILFFFGAPIIVQLFGLAPETMAGGFAIQYLHIMCITLCLQAVGQIGMACLRGAGDTFRPMLITAAVMLINLVASPAFTFGWFGLPRWGVQGNALGTLFAFFVSGIVTLAFLLSDTAGLRLRPRHLKLRPHLLRRVLRIGVPSWIEGLLLWSGQISIVYIVMGGTDLALKAKGFVTGEGVTLGAHTATLRIESLAFLPGFGFGAACSALVGQYLGAKKPQEARHAAILCGRLAAVTMTVLAIPMIMFPGFLIRLVVPSDEAVRIGFIPLILAGLAQPGFAYAILRSAALKGAGDTQAPMMATLTGMGLRFILCIALTLLLVNYGREDLGLTVVWTCIFVDLNYRAIYAAIVFAKGKWQHQQV